MDEIKQQLRRLNSAQLYELRKYIDGLLLLPAGGRTEIVGRAASWVMQTFQIECEALAIGRAVSNERARRAVNKAAEELTDYFDRAMPGSALLHKRLVLSLGIRLVYERMANQGLAANPALLATQLMTVPAVLDREFPGYAACGLLGMVVNAGRSTTRASEAAAGTSRKPAHATVPIPRARKTHKLARHS